MDFPSQQPCPEENLDSLQYLPQRSTNLLVWSNLTTGYLAGTGSNMTYLDAAKGAGNRQFYRLLIRQP